MSRAKILAADDDPISLTILNSILTNEFDLRLVESGEEALSVAKEFQPDLALLDIVMSGIDGYETCRRMRQSPDLRFTKIILVSAKAKPAERLKGYEAGADDYVTKPIEHLELLAKVKVFLRLKSVEELDRLKTDFMTLLGHELRTPLTGILGALDLVYDAVPSEDAKSRELLTIIDQSAQRLKYLVERTMALASIKSGTADSQVVVVDPGHCVQDTVNRWEDAHDQRGRVVFSKASIQPMKCDESGLRLLVSCLLDYALSESPEDEAIRVSTEFVDDCLVVSITDKRRTPLDDDSIERALLVYSVADVSHHGGELRLDLPLASELARRMKGIMTMTSDATRGTRISVAIPPNSTLSPADGKWLKKSA